MVRDAADQKLGGFEISLAIELASARETFLEAGLFSKEVRIFSTVSGDSLSAPFASSSHSFMRKSLHLNLIITLGQNWLSMLMFVR